MPAAIQQNSSLSSLPLNFVEDPRQGLSPVQAKVINALALDSSVTAAATAAGVHRTTIHHWLRTSDEFAAALDNARKQYAEQLRDHLQELSAKALATLNDLLTNPNTPPSVRLRTALAVLQRPSFPKQPWALPVSIESAEHDAFVRRLEHRKAEHQLRMPDPAPEPLSETTPRSAPCPCGSGLKYKRCCGLGAPAVLTPQPPQRGSG